MDEKLQYPIGKFMPPAEITSEMLEEYIEHIENFPQNLESLISNLTEDQLQTPYRPDGWTVEQLLNHCADSHMNSLIRYKLALTEDVPTIKVYDEALWAKLEDGSNHGTQNAMLILTGLHKRWSILLRSLSEKDLERKFYHPGQGREMSLRMLTALYNWHCTHHLAHISKLIERENW